MNVEPEATAPVGNGDASDEPVVVAASGVGKAAEFSAFMVEAWPALGRTALLLTGDPGRAEELVQNALVKTYVAWKVARERDPLAYARRVLVNVRIDTWRRARREVLLAPLDLPEPPAPGPSAAERREDVEPLIRALRALPTKRRRIVVLRYLEGLSEREVADLLGIPVGTVKSSAARGLTELRVALSDRPTYERGASRHERGPS